MFYVGHYNNFFVHIVVVADDDDDDGDETKHYKWYTSNNNIKYELKHKERKPAVKTNRKILTQNITPTCW